MAFIREYFLLSATLMYTLVLLLGATIGSAGGVMSAGPARIVLTGLALYSIGTTKLQKQLSWTQWFTLALLVFIVLRCLSDTVLLPIPLWKGPSVLLPLVFTVCVSTVAALFLEDSQKLPSPISVALFATLLVMVLGHGLLSARETFMQGLRLGGEALNPILVSSFSLTLATVAVAQIVTKRTQIERVLLLYTAVVGIIGTVLPATRSQFLALLLAAVLILASLVRHHRMRFGTLLSSLAGFLTLAVVGNILVTSLGGISVFSRFLQAASGSAGVRDRSFVVPAAFQAGLDYPLLGVSLGLREAGYIYPHNSIAQGYMALGAFGGTFFAILLLIGIARSVAVIWSKPLNVSWPWLLCLQWLVTSLFSFSMFFEPAMMVALAFALTHTVTVETDTQN